MSWRPPKTVWEDKWEEFICINDIIFCTEKQLYLNQAEDFSDYNRISDYLIAVEFISVTHPDTLKSTMQNIHCTHSYPIIFQL